MKVVKRKKTIMSLSDAFPEIAAQWDYELNGDLTPESVSYGSNQKVWWKCPICGHSYPKKISNRTAPAKRKTESVKCPICLGRIIIPGYNSLKARYPELVAQEWDFEKNTIDPDSISPHYRTKVWWKCPNGHSYDSLPGNKVQKTGGNCPYCSSQKGACEKNHEFFRYIEPKYTSLDHLTQEKINLIFSNINSVYRTSLNGVRPIDLAEIVLGKEFLQIIGIKKIEPDEVNLTQSLTKKIKHNS